MATLLGIDLGTTSFKAVAYTEEGEALATARVEPPDERITVDGVAVDVWRPDKLWVALCTLTREIVGQLPGGHVDGVAIAQLGLVGLPLDARGDPLHPAVTWLEPGAGATAVLARSGLDDEALYEIVGNRLNPIYPPAWIGWLREREPAFGDRMARWAFSGDWLASRLCGELATEYAIASQLLALDQKTLELRADLLAAFGLKPDLFHAPRQAGTPLGRVTPDAARDTGLPAGVELAVGGSDYITGIYGAGLYEAGQTAILTGTWELVVSCADQPPLSPELREAGAICDPHVAPGRWSTRIENFAGEITEWYRDALDAGADWTAILDRAGEAPVGSGGVVFLPHLMGSYGPVHDELARGAFVGLNRSTNRAHLARAVFEGLSFQTRHAVDALAEGLGEAPERVVSMGGGSRNRLWLQSRADVLNRPLEVIADPDVTPRGAAMLAGVGLGVFADHFEAARRLAPDTTVIQPGQLAAEVLDQLYQRAYLPALEALAPVHQRLAGRNTKEFV